MISGDGTTENKEELMILVRNVLEHPMLKTYYQDNFKVYNERDIITSTGQLLRPDRLNINVNNEAIIIDYKTGDAKRFHAAQLSDYEAVLNQMNLKVTHKLVVYINDTIEVLEV